MTDRAVREAITDHGDTSEQRFRALIENTHDVVLLVDAEAKIRYASPALERVLGYSPEERIGTSAFDMIHPDDLPSIHRLFSTKVQSPGATAVAEYRVRHHDGSWRIMEAVGRSLFDDPAVRGGVITARDITERRRAEVEQQAMRERLAQGEKLVAMGELLAGVAHELNNPLAVVIGHAAILKTSATDSTVAARAEKIAVAAERCGRIVKNFLALARKHVPERRPTDVNTLIREAAELLAYPLRLDNVVVRFDLDGEMPLILADAHQLHQVLVNLLTNAHYALRQIPAPRRLDVRSRVDRASDGVQVEISDNGGGIPPDVEARIFEPFFTTKPVGQGTGLGLPMCKGIVEAHGGALEVEGRPGQGALFRVRLPIGGRAEASARPGVREHRLGHGERVLVVDDEAAVSDMLCEILTAAGYRTDTASNGHAALRKIAALPYDAIVSDIRMPDLDGVGLYRAVEAQSPRLCRRFVLVTGDTLSAGTAAFLEQTAAPCLTKPFTITDVLAAVAHALQATPASDGPLPSPTWDYLPGN